MTEGVRLYVDCHFLISNAEIRSFWTFQLEGILSSGKIHFKMKSKARKEKFASRTSVR